MKISKIRLQNFRAFEDQEITFNPRMTILIGDNASGKTTILDALRIVLGSWFLGLPDVESHHIQELDVRKQFVRHARAVSAEEMWPVSVSAIGMAYHQRVVWSRKRTSRKGRTNRVDAKGLKKIAADYYKRVQNGEAVTLPVLAYYPAGRLWLKETPEFDTSRVHSRLLGYKACLRAESDQRRVIGQWRERVMIGLQDGEPLPQLLAIGKAVREAIPFAERVYYSQKLKDLVVDFQNGSSLPFSALSDGYRSTLAMIADIADRAATLNPHLAEDAVTGSPGVVLIDEIDLHLHPTWQRHILADLRRIFPQIQFIVTTHAPQVLVSSQPGEVQIIKKDEDEITFHQVDIPPGLHADQVLTGFWFGLNSTLDPDTLSLLEEHRVLLRKDRLSEAETAREKAIVQTLRDRLGRYSDTSLERLALSAVAEATRDVDLSDPNTRDQIRQQVQKQLEAKRRGGVDSI